MKYFARSIEFRALEKIKVVTRASKLLELNPVTQQSLLIVAERLKHGNIPHSSKYPIILRPNHTITNLKNDDSCKTFHHCSREQGLLLSREKYWIVNGKTAVKGVLGKFLDCKKLKIRPNPQLIGKLSKERLAIYKPPFIHTGIDYFGPLPIKQYKKTRSPLNTIERYGTLFIRLTTQLVHLELAGDMSTDSFILALRRFVIRRGKPNTIWLDKGSNFEGAEREL